MRIESLEARRLIAAGQERAAELDACLAKEKDSLRRINSARKYGDDLKAKSFDFRDDLERALIKTCFADDAGTARLPSDRPTLLIIVDDLELGMQEPRGEFTVKQPLPSAKRASLRERAFLGYALQQTRRPGYDGKGVVIRKTQS